MYIFIFIYAFLNHQLNGHEFEQTLGDGEGQGSLVFCSPWNHRVGHNLASVIYIYIYMCVCVCVCTHTCFLTLFSEMTWSNDTPVSVITLNIQILVSI